ncbi:MAG: hypothetical protein V2I53_04740 [Paracoccaceae bacterium]|jgi:hypothetical protein|nr:hypothetical protein [Paracoccaceae bacterium]
MDSDMALVIGLVIAGFSAPSIMSAFSDGRAPRIATIALVVGGALVIYALSQKPGGYRIEDIPKAFIKVIGNVF